MRIHVSHDKTTVEVEDNVELNIAHSDENSQLLKLIDGMVNGVKKLNSEKP